MMILLGFSFLGLRETVFERFDFTSSFLSSGLIRRLAQCYTQAQGGTPKMDTEIPAQENTAQNNVTQRQAENTPSEDRPKAKSHSKAGFQFIALLAGVLTAMGGIFFSIIRGPDNEKLVNRGELRASKTELQ